MSTPASLQELGEQLIEIFLEALSLAAFSIRGDMVELKLWLFILVPTILFYSSFLI